MKSPLAPLPPTAAYLHIPFCRRRCYYCDFAVSVVGDQQRGETSRAIAQYVEVLCQEIRATPNLGLPLQTVFFGGGTPSLLSVAQLQQILAVLEDHFGFAAAVEISMEMDPGTFARSHLQGYLAAGVNRVSLGVQAFQQELLAACGRTHTPEDIETAVALLRQEGVQNLSLDLIAGLPHQTMVDWQESLERAIALQPTHISVYDLTVEPVTAFGRWYQPGVAPLPTEEATAEMYRTAQRYLTAAGYTHYEISNYAKPGFQCRHNRVYWENQSYYGFGMGAASYTQLQRFTRPRKRAEYFEWVNQLQQAAGQIDCPPTTPEECWLDTLMLGLRLAEGLALTDLTAQFGQAKVDQLLQSLASFSQCGWVQFQEAPTGKRICLTDPEGFLFSNVVLTHLFNVSSG
ncbi:MAG TPA: coproporphyrinogen III oxidase [Synechococcales cyanobacterium M55_K2018_004]|nr:coproporphyrinogen III oxidase [Synechococcales cyanobacterium M55_K2018_004]